MQNYNMQIFKMQNYRLEVSFLDPPIIPPGGQRIPPDRPKWRINFVLLSIKISFSENAWHAFVFGKILGRFGVVLGPSWGHFWHLWRAKMGQFGPKRVLEAYRHQKREFSPNTMPADTAAIFGAPRCLPKCPKIGPRRLQEAPEEQLFRSWKSS